MTPTIAAAEWRWAGALTLLALLLGALYGGRVQVDDAFITYRYADNLAQHGLLRYRLAGDAAFATTAPGYAVVLAALARVGVPPPVAGVALGALATAAAAVALTALLWPRQPRAAPLAGALLALMPLPWLVSGMEGMVALALALCGLAAHARGRPYAAALLLALAPLIRFDAVTAVAVWALWALQRDGWRDAWRPLLLCAATAVALYGALMLAFDVPLPGTLGSKRAQQALGISGFFPDTTWLGGVALLARAYLGQSPLYALLAALALVGAGRAVVTRDGTQGALLLWALLHAALYVALGVTPYLWYFLPLLVPLCALAAGGALTVVDRLPAGTRRVGWAVALLALLAGPLASHGAALGALARSADGGPPTAASKVLPEAKGEPYRAAGEWLAANSPPDALVGVTEVGIMGYYSQRPMVDFLGLLDAEVAAALGRGDLSWALYARQPDYLVLSDRNPIYGYDAYKDGWFQGRYEPVRRVPGSGFWGGDLTIYRRADGPPIDRAELPTAARFGDALELVAVEAPSGPWRAGQALDLTLEWRVLAPLPGAYTLFVHLVDEKGRIISARNAPPLLGERPTDSWRAGETLRDFHPIALPLMPEAPSELRYEIGLYDAEGVRLPLAGTGEGALFLPAARLLPSEEPLRFAAADGAEPSAALLGYAFGAEPLPPGVERALAFDLEVSEPLTLTVELRRDWDTAPSWVGEQRVERSGRVVVPVTLGPEASLGWTAVRVRLATEAGPLAWHDRAGHAALPEIVLTEIYVVP